MSETNVMRVLGVSALALAFTVTIAITVNSGVLGDDSGGTVEPAPVPAAAETVPEAAPEQTEAPAEAPAGQAPAEETSPITLETQTYVIEGGDSFFSIATKFNTTIDELQRLNPEVNPQNLSPGTELVVPKQAGAE